MFHEPFTEWIFTITAKNVNYLSAAFLSYPNHCSVHIGYTVDIAIRVSLFLTYDTSSNFLTTTHNFRIQRSDFAYCQSFIAYA